MTHFCELKVVSLDSSLNFLLVRNCQPFPATPHVETADVLTPEFPKLQYLLQRRSSFHQMFVFIDKTYTFVQNFEPPTKIIFIDC